MNILVVPGLGHLGTGKTTMLIAFRDFFLQNNVLFEPL